MAVREMRRQREILEIPMWLDFMSGSAKEEGNYIVKGSPEISIAPGVFGLIANFCIYK